MSRKEKAIEILNNGGYFIEENGRHKMDWRKLGEYWDTDGHITRDSDPSDEFEKYKIVHNESYKDSDEFTLQDFEKYIDRLQEG